MPAKKTTEEFIQDAIKVHGDRYDYSKVEYKNSKTKVIIICPEHGEFKQIPNGHLRGAQCFSCAGSKKYTTEEWIENAKETHKNKYDYSKVEYINSKTKVIIICKIHGDFKQLPQDHINGSKCSKCSGTYSYTTDEWINKAQEIHGNKYDYSKVNYINMNTKIIIGCKTHGYVEQTPKLHMKSNGCPKCSTSYNYTTKEWIKKAKESHGDIYDYSKVKYKNSKTKVIIICKEHDEFKQLPNSHISGYGCNKCGIINGSNKLRLTSEQFIKKAKKIHGNKYDYSKVKYKNSKTKVIIICKKHGNFFKIPYEHLKGSGCLKCYNIYNYTTEEWIKKAKESHGDIYDYSKVKYKNSKTKVIIICKKHGKFIQNPACHLYGDGCSKCSGKYSYTTEEWIEKAKQIHDNIYDYSKVYYKSSHAPIIIICKDHGEFNLKPYYHTRGQCCPKCNKCPSCGFYRTGGKLCTETCSDKAIKKYREKAKEWIIVRYLQEKLPDYDFIHNKSVGSHCTKDEKENSNGHLFPDIRFDCDFYHLIVEVDEHKHRGADYKCDEQRMYNIIAKLGLPCIFIRYNPDSKESNKEILLEKVQEYLEFDIEDDDIWDDFGFKAEYLFY
jgi:hypothetical protein